MGWSKKQSDKASSDKKSGADLSDAQQAELDQIRNNWK